MSIGKICDLCGLMYVPYGAIIEQEDVVVSPGDILTAEAIELLDYETGNPSIEDDAAGEVPEENGFRLVDEGKNSVHRQPKVEINHDVLNQLFYDSVEEQGAEIECPHCHRLVHVSLGDNTCDFCGGKIVVSVDRSK